jgi:hypothetical protein
MFQLLGEIQPDSNESGFVEYIYPLEAGIQPNRYAGGPFCRLRHMNLPQQAGVYAITTDDRLQYLGECENLAARFGPRGYGRISPRNIHSDGQATNCKINALILETAKSGLAIDLWFHSSSDRKTVEEELINQLKPAWNGRSVRRAIPNFPAAAPERMKSSARDDQQANTIAQGFRDALEQEFTLAATRGDSSVRVRASGLLRKVGGYPGKSHRMPICCAVMRSLMLTDDKLVDSPAKGAGASLTIEYKLPRP